jgi:hypothetical protein
LLYKIELGNRNGGGGVFLVWRIFFKLVIQFQFALEQIFLIQLLNTG